MTWPTDEAREAVRQALTMTVEDVHVVIVDRDGTTSGGTSVGIDAEGFADAALDALAPHVAALVRAERAAALREAVGDPAITAYLPPHRVGGARRFMLDRAEAEEAGR